MISCFESTRVGAEGLHSQVGEWILVHGGESRCRQQHDSRKDDRFQRWRESSSLGTTVDAWHASDVFTTSSCVAQVHVASRQRAPRRLWTTSGRRGAPRQRCVAPRCRTSHLAKCASRLARRASRPGEVRGALGEVRRARKPAHLAPREVRVAPRQVRGAPRGCISPVRLAGKGCTSLVRVAPRGRISPVRVVATPRARCTPSVHLAPGTCT